MGSQEIACSATTRTRAIIWLATLEEAINHVNHCGTPDLYSMDSVYPLSINNMIKRGRKKRKREKKSLFKKLFSLNGINEDPEEQV